MKYYIYETEDSFRFGLRKTCMRNKAHKVATVKVGFAIEGRTIAIPFRKKLMAFVSYDRQVGYWSVNKKFASLDVIVRNIVALGK